MSGIIQYTTRIKYTDTDKKISKTILDIPSGRITREASTIALVENIQAVGFGAHEVIVMGDVTAPGFATFLNVSAANFVQIGIVVSAVFKPCMKLYPGDSQQVWLEPGETWYAKANTASVDLCYSILQRNP